MNKSQITILEYTALIIILSVGAYFYINFKYFPFKQFMVVVAVSFAYVLWGTIYHLVRVRLYWHVIYEYILVASLVILLFAFTLNVL